MSEEELPKGVLEIGPPIVLCNRCNQRLAIKAEKISNPILGSDLQFIEWAEYWVNTCKECETK